MGGWVEGGRIGGAGVLDNDTASHEQNCQQPHQQQQQPTTTPLPTYNNTSNHTSNNNNNTRIRLIAALW